MFFFYSWVDLSTISSVLELLAELLGPNEDDSVGLLVSERLVQSHSFTRLFQFLPTAEFSIRFPLLRALLYTCQRQPKIVQSAAVR